MEKISYDFEISNIVCDNLFLLVKPGRGRKVVAMKEIAGSAKASDFNEFQDGMICVRADEFCSGGRFFTLNGTGYLPVASDAAIAARRNKFADEGFASFSVSL